MRIAVWCFIRARALLSIWLFHRKLAFILVKFSLCQEENARKGLAHFRLRRSRRGENLVEPTGSASNEIFGSERPWVVLSVTKKNGWRNSRTLVPPMKLKDKIQKVLVARNCCRTDAIPKLPQRESQAQISMLTMYTSRFPLFHAFWLHVACFSKKVWRTKEPKLKQHNTNAADEIF